MDNKNQNNAIVNSHDSKGEGNKMPAVIKKEEKNKGLSLSTKKLDEITVKPKVENGKVLFDRDKKDHRYIVDEEF